MGRLGLGRFAAGRSRIGPGPGDAVTAVTGFLAVTWIALVGGLLFWANVPVLWGWQPRLVLSGSMVPALQPGDVVITAPVVDARLLPAGRVVAVADPALGAGSYLHRVIRRDGAGRLITKGDANLTEDHPAVEPGRVLGEVAVAIPMIGRPVLWARQGDPVPVLVVVVVTGAALLVSARSPADPYRGLRW